MSSTEFAQTVIKVIFDTQIKWHCHIEHTLKAISGKVHSWIMYG